MLTLGCVQIGASGVILQTFETPVSSVRGSAGAVSAGGVVGGGVSAVAVGVGGGAAAAAAGAGAFGGAANATVGGSMSAAVIRSHLRACFITTPSASSCANVALWPPSLPNH